MFIKFLLACIVLILFLPFIFWDVVDGSGSTSLASPSIEGSSLTSPGTEALVLPARPLSRPGTEPLHVATSSLACPGAGGEIGNQRWIIGLSCCSTS